MCLFARVALGFFCLLIVMMLRVICNSSTWSGGVDTQVSSEWINKLIGCKSSQSLG